VDKQLLESRRLSENKGSRSNTSNKGGERLLSKREGTPERGKGWIEKSNWATCGQKKRRPIEEKGMKRKESAGLRCSETRQWSKQETSQDAIDKNERCGKC